MRAKDFTKGNIAYHNELNPAVWDGDELRPEVRYKLLEIAKRFLEYLDVPDFKLIDIVLRGSLVNYNYTAYSDFDLHLITDMSLLDTDIAENYYMAKKQIWNDEHDIIIRGHDVEMYVEDKDDTNVSAGTFSVLDNKWIKIPDYDPPSIDEKAVNAKVRDYIAQINRVLKTGNEQDLVHLKDKIKTMRQSGLEAGGEFSVENLAFKILRNKNYIKKLYQGINRAIDQELSIDEALEECEQGSWTLVEGAEGIEVKKSDMFDSTLASKLAQSPNLETKLREFLNFKKDSPGQSWGGSDSYFVNAGPIGRAMPKLRHAHLTRDLSLFYTIEGRNPTTIKLYGIFSHQESGTGTPGSVQKQKTIAKVLKRQEI